MNYRKYKLELLTFIPAVLFVFAGCATRMQEQLKICPGAGAVFELETLLKSQSENIVPLKANGNCLWQQKTGGKISSQESFNIKLWVDWPASLCLQGDIAFDPKGIILGSNEREYWLAIKPKEVSSYWWGQWEHVDGLVKLKISPRILIEAVGVVEIDAGQDWILSNEGVFDVLTKLDNSMAIKKIYVYNCSKQVAKIEYFDSKGEVIITAELDKYINVAEKFYVPGIIRIVSHVDEWIEDTFLITFSSVKQTEFTDNQKAVLFTRPQAQGFERVIENTILNKQPR